MDYTSDAVPTDEFASKLEFNWAARFKAWKWNFRYIGSYCWWADFMLDDVIQFANGTTEPISFGIEIKPDIEGIVEKAAERIPYKHLDECYSDSMPSDLRMRALFVISGNPGFETWTCVIAQEGNRYLTQVRRPIPSIETPWGWFRKISTPAGL